MLRQLSVEEVCSKLKPIFGKKIDNIYLKYAMAESREEKEDIAHMVSALYNRNLNKLLDNTVLLEPPSEEVMDGEYQLATVSYARKKLFPFALREHDWPRHVCISGMSGSGKTTLALNILRNFIKQDKPFLVFDWKKSFRPLVLASGNVFVFTVGNDEVSNLFKMNINRPPKGVGPKEWINVLCDLLTESFFASYGVHKVLLETLDEAFEEWGIYNGSENYPTWDHIKWRLEEKMKKIRGREAGWVESASRIATVLTFGNFGKVVSSKDEGSLSVEDLLDKQIILELNTLSNIEKKFFCEFVLTYIYKLKKANQKNISGKFDHAILVDEAHNIFLKGTTHFTKESVTDMVYREMREYGTSLICLDQHISKLSDTVKGNSACHIAFQQQLPQDIFDISGLMQLKEQKQFFSMLPVGSAIVKLSERYTSPFLIEVAPEELRDKTVSDDIVKERAKYHIMGISVEKNTDPEFNKALIGKDVLEKSTSLEPAVSFYFTKENSAQEDFDEEIVKAKDMEISEDSEVENPEIALDLEMQETESLEIDSLNELTPVQKVLYEYVEKRLKEGAELKELENTLEVYTVEGAYTYSDVGTVINYALKKQLGERQIASKKPQNVVTPEIQKLYKASAPVIENDKEAESEKFLNFLRAHANEDYGTVDIYKKLGLSSRKGNKIKQELMEKNMIRSDEIKNSKGWKKVIRIVQ